MVPFVKRCTQTRERFVRALSAAFGVLHSACTFGISGKALKCSLSASRINLND